MDKFFNFVGYSLIAGGIVFFIGAIGALIWIASDSPEKSSTVSTTKTASACDSKKEIYGDVEFDSDCYPKTEKNGDYIFRQDRTACAEGNFQPSSQFKVTNGKLETIPAITQKEAEKLYQIEKEFGCIKIDGEGNYLKK